MNDDILSRIKQVVTNPHEHKLDVKNKSKKFSLDNIAKKLNGDKSESTNK